MAESYLLQIQNYGFRLRERHLQHRPIHQSPRQHRRHLSEWREQRHPELSDKQHPKVRHWTEFDVVVGFYASITTQAHFGREQM